MSTCARASTSRMNCWTDALRRARYSGCIGPSCSKWRTASGVPMLYESMRKVSPGDIIFSFRDTRIAALGIARSYCYESPKPTEFGTAGSYWEAIGWKIDLSFRELTNRIHPKSHIGELRGLLP